MGHATATFNGKTIAETDAYHFVEGNVYFPYESILDKDVLSPASNTTYCPWKGLASYYNITVDGKEAASAAWYYPEPKTEKAKPLKDYIAFYKTEVDVKYE